MQHFHLLVAVSDPVVHAEIIALAAATGYEVLDTTDPRVLQRHVAHARVCISDAAIAPYLARIAPNTSLFVVYADTHTIDWQQVVQWHAQNAYLIPRQTQDLLHDISTVTGQRLVHRDHGQGTAIMVTGAVGGCGASTVAAALSLYCAQEHPTVLVDADPHSAGLDLCIGIEETVGVRWSDVNFRSGELVAQELYESLPRTTTGLAVLSPSRVLANTGLSVESVSMAIRALQERYTVVVDVPRYADYRVQLAELADQLVLVTPVEVHAAAACAQLGQQLQRFGVRRDVVARHRGWSGLRIADLTRLVGWHVTGEIFQDLALAKRIETTGLAAAGFSKLPKSMRTCVQALRMEQDAA
ncbi:septum site-determining protein Ssd [Corynebacterium sp. HS2168-gen11]|uniref:septum site-determining protein Ssd n=1 Tax=Corynebacterium sp. HS2168-gen11 TaxID=2974027 RepID=UPI00216ACD47|nr:septum site-determining protein Ssd [Corynebacterium sp. HS2168-gen11]MCS4535935.1 hypothetical protein [Corynebacterium sp. HS2168-gen11]